LRAPPGAAQPWFDTAWLPAYSAAQGIAGRFASGARRSETGPAART